MRITAHHRAKVRLAADGWDEECLELESLRSWLWADGIVALCLNEADLYILKLHPTLKHPSLK